MDVEEKLFIYLPKKAKHFHFKLLTTFKGLSPWPGKPVHVFQADSRGQDWLGFLCDQGRSPGCH